METYRLKNIVILILLLLNVCLLILVISRQYAQYQAQKDLISQTVTLLERNDISIDPELLEGNAALYTYSYSRDAEAEASFAAVLLGEDLTQQDAGGGTYIYSSSAGSATFRANGSFSAQIETPFLKEKSGKEFVQAYCPSNYRYDQTQSSGSYTSITATPQVDGLPVYGASIVFVFHENMLTSVSGFFIPPAELSSEPIDAITKSSAAVYLLDYCNEEGKICNTIDGISTGYILQSTVSAPMLLIPAYKIDTNTYSYYVNSLTGYISPAK